MKHTELPWIHQPDYNDVGNACIDISSEEGAHVVEIYDSYDAAFIVKAVNNHEKLIEALRDVAGFLLCDGQDVEAIFNPCKDEISQQINMIREAIKQAEAE